MENKDFVIKDSVLMKYKGKNPIVYIPEGVKGINDFAFYKSCKILEIHLPSTLVSIGTSLYEQNSLKDLQVITVNGKNPYFDSRENSNAIIETSSNSLIIGCKNTIVPTGVICIKSDAFNSKNIERISIPENVKTIEKCAFKNCKKLHEINLPIHLETLGGACFLNCSSLINLKLPESIEVIAHSLLDGCKKLKEIEIPENVKIIQDHAFKDCWKLKKVILNEGLREIKSSIFFNCKSLKGITLPNSVVYIDTFAFNRIGHEFYIFCENPKTRRGWKFEFEKYPDIHLSIQNSSEKYCPICHKLVHPTWSHCHWCNAKLEKL